MDPVVKLAAFLCTQLKLDSQDVIRHYDVNGEAVSPKYYVGTSRNNGKQLQKGI